MLQKGNQIKKSRGVLFLNHDINNHLGISLGYFELLIEKYPEIKSDKFAGLVLEGMVRTIELSKKIPAALEEHKPENENKTAINDNLKLLSVQEHVVKNVEPDIKKLMDIYDIKIILNIELVEEIKNVYLNPAELVRIRENIVSNALNAGATQLKISFVMKEYCLAVTFEDNGKGMKQEELDKISLSKHGDGIIHGLGTQSIIEEAKILGACLTYSSTLGKGTIVRALIPYAK